jgi:hypothetical protein
MRHWCPRGAQTPLEIAVSPIPAFGMWHEQTVYSRSVHDVSSNNTKITDSSTASTCLSVIALPRTPSKSFASNMASTEIREKAEECLTSFKLLLQIEAEVGEGDKAEEQKNDALRTEDHLARFRIWAGNIGVFASGHASLDYRLKGSEDLRRDMLEFFCTLQEFLRRGMFTHI